MTIIHPAEMGTWTLGGQSMIWVGGAPLNLEVFEAAAPIQTDNVEEAGVQGRVIRDAWIEQAEHDVYYHLSATVMANGTPATSKMAAFRSNYNKLLTLVGNPTTWSGSGITSVYTPYGGSPKSAVVQASVSPWDHQVGKASGSVMPCVVTVIIPTGAHA